MRRRGFTKLELVVVLALVVLLAAVVLPIFAARRDRRDCMANIRQLGVGMKMYLSDYDERYPLVRTPGGWSGGMTYIMVRGYFGDLQCPREGTLAPGTNGRLKFSSSAEYPDPTLPHYTDYWFNANLSGIEEGEVQLFDRTVLLGEGNDGTDKTDARYNKTSLPTSWLSDRSKPSFRHHGGAHYVFADGHATWLEPHQLSTKPAATVMYTFAVK